MPAVCFTGYSSAPCKLSPSESRRKETHTEYYRKSKGEVAGVEHGLLKYLANTIVTKKPASELEAGVFVTIVIP